MKVIEAIRDYISNCPALETFNINVNYLEDDYDSFSIEETPCDPVLRRYIDGSMKKQCQFVFTSKEPYSSDVICNIDNSNFYEEFSNWIETNNKEGIFPLLEEGLEPTQIKVISSPYVITADEDKAIYQVQMNLIYLKKGSR
jgi:hypothetical protein